jgi:putative ABC transport system substrate-binding protein
MIERREFITLLGGAAAWPLVARAQQAGMPVVGFLNTASADAFAHLVVAFRRGLNQSGYVEGENIVIEYRWAGGRYDRVPELAAELVERGVNVLAAFSPPAALAAKAATASIPIVIVSGDDPVKLGLIASLNRPGGNVTGVSLFTVALGAKRHELLHDLMPAATAIGVLINPDSPNAEPDIGDARRAARVLGWQIAVVNATTELEFDAAFAKLLEQRVAALVVGNDQFFNSRRERIVTLADRQSLPTIYPLRDFTVAGGLMSYGPSISEAYREAGVYAGRILKGMKPADLPVVQPTKFELVINLKTAKALGLTVPSTLLARADEVIE